MPSATAAKAKKANANANPKSKVNKAPAVTEIDEQSDHSEDESDFGTELDVEDESAGSDEEDEDEHDLEEGVSDENEDEENQSAGSGSDSDSDSLDSDAPRKRRRTSPTIDDIVAQLEDEEEDDTPVAPVKPVFNNVPSRIKKKQPEASKTEKTEEATPALPVPEPASTVSVPIDANTTFDALNVRPWLVQSLANMAIKRPTGIQKGCIPEILKGRDCIGGSRTGSGKTVAFAVPILQQWAANPSAIFGVILTPTR